MQSWKHPRYSEIRRREKCAYKAPEHGEQTARALIFSYCLLEQISRAPFIPTQLLLCILARFSSLHVRIKTLQRKAHNVCITCCSRVNSESNCCSLQSNSPRVLLDLGGGCIWSRSYDHGPVVLIRTRVGLPFSDLLKRRRPRRKKAAAFKRTTCCIWENTLK